MDNLECWVTVTERRSDSDVVKVRCMSREEFDRFKADWPEDDCEPYVPPKTADGVDVHEYDCLFDGEGERVLVDGVEGDDVGCLYYSGETKGRKANELSTTPPGERTSSVLEACEKAGIRPCTYFESDGGCNDACPGFSAEEDCVVVMAKEIVRRYAQAKKNDGRIGAEGVSEMLRSIL